MRLEDEEYSIARYLVDKYGFTNYPERAQEAISRPYFRVENFAHLTSQAGKKGFIDLSTWVIWYMGTSRKDCMKIRSEIISELQTARKIDGYMEDFIFPVPRLQSVVASGGVLSGNINVAITGLLDGVEGLLSPVQVIDVVDDSIKIQFPKVPKIASKFDSYNIYAGIGAGVAPTLQSNIVHTIGREGTNEQTTLTDLISGAAAPTSSVQLFGRIFVESIAGIITEDDIEPGVWDARIELVTQSNGLLDEVESWLLDQVTLASDNNLISGDLPVVLP